ncbi:MAG TPA: VCBS repeat-containing protein, partial [Bryobacteraceae bacterium]|nr:VCBS repeat-containing protein [Bryobacteraceae bacterium]
MLSLRILGLLLAQSTILAQSFNFLPATPYPAGNGPLSAATGDFNGDGKSDLAVGDVASGSISIFLGNAKGSFTPGTPIAIPNCPVGFVATGDFNRDGHPDLLALCQFQSTVWVVPGLANGGFGTPIPTTVPDIILFGYGNGIFQTCVVDDFNNDGIPDLIITLTDANFSLDSGRVALLLGKGDGTFQPASTVLTASSAFLPNVILAADFDRDGNQDLLIAGGPVNNTGPAVVETFLGNGMGGFQSSGSFNLPADYALAGGLVADLNKDRIPDLVLVQGSLTSRDQSSDVSVYLGKGDGTFQELTGGPALELEASGLLAVDLRGTGNLDLVGVVEAGEATSVGVCAGNGDGTFQRPVNVAFASGWEPWFETIVAGDWNGDGLTDLAFTALPLGFQQSGPGNSGNPQQNAIEALEELPAGDLVVILNGITPAPALAVAKTQLQFAYVAGSTAPIAQSVAISNSGTGTLTWSAASDS